MEDMPFSAPLRVKDLGQINGQAVHVRCHWPATCANVIGVSTWNDVCSGTSEMGSSNSSLLPSWELHVDSIFTSRNYPEWPLDPRSRILNSGHITLLLLLYNLLGYFTPKEALCVLVAQSCLTLCNPMGYSSSGSSVHRSLQSLPFLKKGVFHLAQGAFIM